MLAPAGDRLVLMSGHRDTPFLLPMKDPGRSVARHTCNWGDYEALPGMDQGGEESAASAGTAPLTAYTFAVTPIALFCSLDTGTSLWCMTSYNCQTRQM